MGDVLGLSLTRKGASRRQHRVDRREVERDNDEHGEPQQKHVPRLPRLRKGTSAGRFVVHVSFHTLKALRARFSGHGCPLVVDAGVMEGKRED